MIAYPDYKTATNEAYRMIAERDCFSIETNVFAIAEQLENCRLFSYGAANFIYNMPMDSMLATSEYGFSIKKNGKKNHILQRENAAFLHPLHLGTRDCSCCFGTSGRRRSGCGKGSELFREELVMPSSSIRRTQVGI